jgi:gluconolactonase
VSGLTALRAEVLVDGLDHPEGVAYDPQANVLWAGGEAGQLYRIDPDARSWAEVARAPGFVLGVAVDGRGRVLLCASSDGSLCVRRFDGTVLDGLACTSDGGLLVSCYRPDRIYHLDRDGAVEIVAEDPQGTLIAAPTNVCFMGRNLSRTVCANLGRWHLTELALGLEGAPLHRPTRWALDALGAT